MYLTVYDVDSALISKTAASRGSPGQARKIQKRRKMFPRILNASLFGADSGRKEWSGLIPSKNRTEMQQW